MGRKPGDVMTVDLAAKAAYWTDDGGTIVLGTTTPNQVLTIVDNSEVVINDDACDFRVEGSDGSNLLFVNAGTSEVLVNNSPVVTEDRLRSLVEDVLETKQENDLLKRFAQSLLEKLYGEGD